MHLEAIWRNPLNRTHPDHYKWLSTQTEVPVYMQEVYPDVPMSVKYPLQEILDMLVRPYFNKTPFGSTPAYALAWGIYKGYPEIECYGIELGTDTEYYFQREEFCYWCGVASGRKVKVTLYTDKLLNSPMYGYEGEWSVPVEHFEQRIAELVHPIEEARVEYNRIAEHTNRCIAEYKERPNEEHYNHLASAINDLNIRIKDFGILDGASQENERYLKKAKAMVEASGSYIFSRQELESAKMSLLAKHEELKMRAVDRATSCRLLLQGILVETSDAGRNVKFPYVADVIDQYAKATLNLAMIAGALAENFRYLEWVDKHIKALGGEKALESVLNTSGGGMPV